jgi:protoporphyrinogen oxidase
MSKKRVIVVGAGPAGLSAALELVRAGHEVTILESDPQYVGGLARTMSYKGYRFDIGAHRFFSKSAEICRWWQERLPNDFVEIKRLTRIHYRGRFFHYPLRPWEAMIRLGFGASLSCGWSYLWRKVRCIRPEKSFEDWVTNRFGDRLYQIFFKTYTEKVWGMPCSQISADWASQRIKGLSLRKAIWGALWKNGKKPESVKTLVDHFYYPRLGAGMMWERARDEILNGGGKISMGRTVTAIEWEGIRVTRIQTITTTGESEYWRADEFIMSMPLRDCVLAMKPLPLPEVCNAARQLAYRDFIIVVLIVNQTDLFPDNWIYVHDPAVKVGRIENFSNWSPEMSPDPATTCLELEYFCSVNDPEWRMSESEWITLAKNELEHLGLAQADQIIDGCVVRVEKAYPVYDHNYRRNVEFIRQTLTRFHNLQVAGRNGMHKYNNQDHSMATGIMAAKNIDGVRHDVWQVNGDAEYHEEESVDTGRQVPKRIALPERG